MIVQAPWLSMLAPTAAERFAQLGQRRTFGVGERLFAGPALHLMLIEDGEVEVTVTDGDPVRLGRHDLVGGASLDSGLGCDEVVARAPVSARHIDPGELVDAFRDRPAELRAILDAVAARSSAVDARRCVARLAQDSLRHRAVRHPYLAALAAGALPDLAWALRDFACQYYFYSCHFPRYLTTVISRLDDPQHRRLLLDNLTEESGHYEEEELAELARLGVAREWVVGIPHPQLFRRFSEAIGAHPRPEDERDQVACWREQLLDVLASGTAAEAVGALGLGTENIVRTIYLPFVAALERLGTLAPRDTVFFPLHTAIDDDHQASLQAISADFARTPEGRTGLRRGMLKALSLRAGFWDWMLARALDPEHAEEVL